jgi:hypothetical protein
MNHEAKEFKDYIPFSLYDFFGYIFPGIFLFLSLVLMLYEIDSPIRENLANWISSTFNDQQFLFVFFTIVFFFVIVYAAGHVIATLSHLFIDRVLISGTTGYPILFLFDIPNDNAEKYFFVITYKLLFISVELILITFGFLTIFSSYNVLYYLLYAIISLGFFLGLYRIFSAICYHYHQALYEKLKYLASPLSGWLEKMLNPIFELLHKLTQTNKKFPKQFIQNYKNNFEKDFGLKADESNTENYWLPFFKTTTHSPYHAYLINNWLLLYGFSRNMAAACFLICSIMFVSFPSSFSFLSVNSKHAFQAQFWITLGLGNIFLLRYYVLYFVYFTKSIVRAYYVLDRE